MEEGESRFLNAASKHSPAVKSGAIPCALDTATVCALGSLAASRRTAADVVSRRTL